MVITFQYKKKNINKSKIIHKTNNKIKNRTKINTYNRIMMTIDSIQVNTQI